MEVKAMCHCCNDMLDFDRVSGELYLCEDCQKELGVPSEVEEFQEDHQP